MNVQWSLSVTYSNSLVFSGYRSCMAKTVKVPDPVYSKIQRQSERQDVSMGVVVRDWMDKAEKFDELEIRR